MNISQLAKQTGIAPSTIRYYEKMRVLPKTKRDVNGYRNYDESHLQLLWTIAQAKQVGFSLAEIQDLLATQTDGWQHDKLIDRLQQKIEDIEKMQHTLEQSKRNLQQMIANIKDKPAEISCEQNARRLMQPKFLPDV